MRMWIVAGVLVLAVAGVAAAAGVKLVNEPPSGELGACQTEPASDSQPTYVVLVGTNGSDHALIEVHRRHLREVVLATAADDGARVVVGTISDDSAREPVLAADVSLSRTGDGSDNPENQAVWADEKAEKILDCVDSAMGAPPADRSDVFGGLAWAASVLPPEAQGRHVVVLSDSINTTEGCNLTGRDLSANGREQVAADCGQADYSALAGANLWFGGIGLTSGQQPAPSVTPTSLVDFWTWFVERHDAHVSRAAATLLPTG